MARIAGVDLPREKRVEVALTYIHGIVRPTSNRLLSESSDWSRSKARCGPKSP